MLMRARRSTATIVYAFIAVALAVVTVRGLVAGGQPTRPVLVNGLAPGVSLPSAVPAGVPNDRVDRLNVSLTTCQNTTLGWRAGGSIRNSTKAPATYQVTVFFTTTEGTVLSFGDTRVDVPAAASQEWSIESSFVAPESTLCVLRGAAVE